MVGSMSKPNKRKYNSFFIREFNQNEEVDMEPRITIHLQTDFFRL